MCRCIESMAFSKTASTYTVPASTSATMCAFDACSRLLKIRAEHVSHVGGCQLEDRDKASDLTVSAAMKAATWHSVQGDIFSAPGMSLQWSSLTQSAAQPDFWTGRHCL